MTVLEILYLSLAVGFLVLVVYVSAMANSITQTMRKLNPILDDVNSVTKDVKDLKEKAKAIATTIIFLLQSLVGKHKAENKSNKKGGK